MGYSFAEVLNGRRVGGVPDRPARHDDTAVTRKLLARPRPASRGASRGPAPRPAASASPLAPPPRRALSDRELYQTWLRLSLVPDTPAIVEWPNVYLAARDLGLTRLGRSDYRPEQWRKAVQRLVREGGAIPFWWRTRGRPPRVLTTQQHLAAWAIAGYHLRLGRRRRT